MNRETSDSYHYSREGGKRLPVTRWTSLQVSQGSYPSTSHGQSSSYSYYPSYGSDSARPYSNSRHGNYTSQQQQQPQQWTETSIPIRASGSSHQHHHHLHEPSLHSPEDAGSHSRTPSSSRHTHDVRALPTMSDSEIGKWLDSYTFNDKLYWRCRWEGCTDPLLPRGPQAYDHVARHLAVKQYECTTCGKTFATKATASRHLNTQEKTFPCQYCGNYFARKDYRNTHEKKCQLAPLTY